ncbi:Zinc finger HIT domain-containing protein 1 -like protein [Trametes pubescens]|uniref:Zinc finger HIT domain-containing protein 1-like protein n=1 Tax=Trametes pubescens TaxID=154538 RepID=A0A1M2VB53_TRAPU|nr:Zinc finger HIT domain-containing protein 1 -like protein [Trametes pubescens]
MPPARRQHPEVIAKRTKRHLDELEVRRPSASWTLQGLHLRDAPPSQRSNYSEPAGAGAGGDEEDDHGVAPGGRTAKGRARQTIISDKGKKPKKSTMNVRTAVLYKKTLAVLIEDSGIEHLPPGVPTYLRAVAPPPREPPRMLCSVCGFWGKYKCRRCAMPYCDLSCEGVHNETRCERRVM